MNVSVTGGPPVVVTTIAAALEGSQPVDGSEWIVSVDGLRRGADGSIAPAGDAGRGEPDVLVVIRLGARVPADIEALKRRYPAAALVWVAGEPNGREVADAVAWGCSCVISQGSALDDLVQGVQHAAAGTAWTTPDLVRSVMDYIRSPTPDVDGGLTARELEVLSLLRAGRSTRQISDELYISQHTTKNHVRRILAKLQAHSRLEAIAIAERRRLIGPGRDTAAREDTP